MQMEPFTFSSREAFRTWLAEHAHTSEGIYIRFVKGKQTQTLTANQALEEAFGRLKINSWSKPCLLKVWLQS